MILKNYKKIGMREFDLVFSNIHDKKISDRACICSSKREKRDERLNQKKIRNKVLVVIIILHL